MEDQNALLLKLFSAGALGYVIQWTLFAPKKVASWVAWGALIAASVLLYWWATPTLTTDWAANWRYSIVGLISFFLTARGTGATAVSANTAPPTNTTP